MNIKITQKLINILDVPFVEIIKI